MPAGLGGGGWMAFSLEAENGVYQPPNTAGTVFIPILTDSFQYREDKYYSPQIRQQVIVSDVQQSYYHIEGDIRMEADPNFLPYMLACSRHEVAFATGVYTYTPSSAGSVFSESGIGPKTASITIARNDILFGYAGCVAGGFELTIDNGVLIYTFNMLGLSENDVDEGDEGTPAWIDPNLFGAAAHAVYVDESGTAPAFADTDVNFNGFTFNANFNASAQNRLVRNRAATYIAYGESEITYTTELDFVDKAEYNSYQDAETRAIRLESIKGGADWAGATVGHRLTCYRTAYDTYEVALGGMGDLIMAGTTGRIIGIAGAPPYRIEVRSPVTITWP